MPVVQFDAEHRVGKRFEYCAFSLDEVFTCHFSVLCDPGQVDVVVLEDQYRVFIVAGK